VHSQAGDDWRAVKDHVLGRLRIPPERRGRPVARAPERRRKAPQSSSDDVERRRRALALSHAAGDPTDTVVERYLASSDIALPDDLGVVLRFQATCAFGDERMPVMVDLLRFNGERFGG